MGKDFTKKRMKKLYIFDLIMGTLYKIKNNKNDKCYVKLKIVQIGLPTTNVPFVCAINAPII